MQCDPAVSVGWCITAVDDEEALTSALAPYPFEHLRGIVDRGAVDRLRSLRLLLLDTDDAAKPLGQ
jgi:hypothetical protein